MSFKVIGYYLNHPNLRHHIDSMTWMKEGLKKHGIDMEMIEPLNPKLCDLAVIWGHRQEHIREMQKSNGKDYLVIERGFIGDRFKWCSMGYNGLNGRADFLSKGSSSDRWNKYFGNGWLKPWKKEGQGDYILVAGQVEGDASVRSISVPLWTQHTIELIKKHYPTFPIRYRPHPISVKWRMVRKYEGVETSSNSLEEDLKGAKFCVNYNSNIGTDSILSGIPVMAYDEGSMVWSLASHNIRDPQIRPDRKQWAYDMAYSQWSPDEIRNGEAWNHLKRKFEDA